jgi:antitoxin component of MazEF toxin-antitoxin module
MTTTVKIEKIGDKFVLPLSEMMLEKLGVTNGGEIEAIDFEDHIELRSAQNDNERRKEFRNLADEMFEDYKELFAALAEGAK